MFFVLSEFTLNDSYPILYCIFGCGSPKPITPYTVALGVVPVALQVLLHSGSPVGLFPVVQFEPELTRATHLVAAYADGAINIAQVKKVNIFIVFFSCCLLLNKTTKFGGQEVQNNIRYCVLIQYIRNPPDHNGFRSFIRRNIKTGALRTINNISDALYGF